MVLFILGRIFGIRGGQNTLFAFSLAQGGEFAFVLITFSLNNGVVSSQISHLLFLVVALSMAITPLLLLFNDRVIFPLVFRSENLGEDDHIEEVGNPVVIAGFGRFGEVMGRFLIANGFRATILDDNPDNIQVLRKFGFNVYYGDATRPDLLAAAGCEEARVIVVAVDDKQKSLKIIDLVQRKYPHLKILARAVDMDHAYEKLGAEIIRCGNLDPVSVIQDHGPHEIGKDTEHLCHKEEGRPFILSGGCEITVNTPVEHLLAMRNASQTN